MFTLTKFSSTERVICLLIATVVVAISIFLGAVGMHFPLGQGYSVTVTQLQ